MTILAVCSDVQSQQCPHYCLRRTRTISDERNSEDALSRTSVRSSPDFRLPWAITAQSHLVGFEITTEVSRYMRCIDSEIFSCDFVQVPPELRIRVFGNA